MICAANPIETCAVRAVSLAAPVEASAFGCEVVRCAVGQWYAFPWARGPADVETRHGVHHVHRGDEIQYWPASNAGGSLITWRAWRDDLGEVGDMEADGAVADAIAEGLGILAGGPLACRLAVYRGVCALCETTAPAGVLEAA